MTNILQNFIQSSIVVFHNTSILLFLITYIFLWKYKLLWPLLIYYTIFHYFRDKSPVNGNVWYKRNESFRNLFIWNYLIDYFPIKFHKLSDLSPTFNNNENEQNERIGPNYIFGYHPHGIIATGVSNGFTNNANNNWNKLFPGIKCFVTTLINQFQIPFYRDYLMALGVTTVVKKNLKILLNKGASIVIVIGGAKEALLAKPGNNSIILNKRKGFIKLALESLNESNDNFKFGISIVPVYAFGENNIYNVYYTGDDDEKNNIGDNKFKKVVYKFQMFLKDKFGWTLPIIVSRGIFNYDFGILPYKTPINVVFGNPIHIKRLNNLKFGDPITQFEIDYWHNQYIIELKNVWEFGKDKFRKPNESNLKIVE
ncbi:diacylglycerol O-acyltransferase [Pichia kluyveri]|uniref:Diacylglycerol O-acyltransferase n=1 Tax=Pichia kluyveri TaxID=36015 RepID=A0AAV5R4N9_PICKL|nr:diacylglycerol O-acyltransferase [Pichia kluyveri]